MKKNLGVADRIIRLMVAAVIAILYFTNVINGISGIIFLLIAGVFLLTGIFGICPLYLPFGLNSNKRRAV